jgi:predicted enzyme related to lactoylglutathione lyase
MAEFTIPKHGEICWRELDTQNFDAAKEFYKGMFGWTLEQSKFSEMTYDEINVGGKAVGGMMPITAEWGEHWQKIPSHWKTYIAVENADETVEKIKQNGGAVCIPPFDAPGVGRMSMVSDPAGAMFSIIQFVAE